VVKDSDGHAETYRLTLRDSRQLRITPPLLITASEPLNNAREDIIKRSDNTYIRSEALIR
jgi:hypothetical protein